MKKLLLNAFCIFAINNINAQVACAPKMVLMEEACAKDCGPCYNHFAHIINPLYAANKNQIAMVVYNKQPIGVGTWSEISKPYRGFGNAFGIGYQSSVMMDRTFFPSNYNITEGPVNETVESEPIAFNDLINATYVPVAINISHTFDPITRNVSIDLTANFCDTASGDLRFYLVLTQDTVKGPGGTYSYAQNVNASVGSVLDGYTVTTLGGFNCIESFPFINVVKHQPSGFFGNAGIISTSPVAGSSYSENYTFTLPLKNSPTEAMDIDPSRIQIVAAVVKSGPFKQRQVLNANKKYLTTGPTSISENVMDNVLFTVNNPVNNTLVITYSAKQQGIGELHLYDASGKIIREEKNIEYSSDSRFITMDVSNLSNGIYFISFKAEGSNYTRKIIISK